jgi:predicted neuraminidase
MRILTALALGIVCIFPALSATAPQYEAELIFPLEKWHNHSSSIVQLPNGSFLVCWFHGSGEREADDVVIEAARWSNASKTWSKPFLLADTPGFPDTNPTMFIDSHEKLFLFWPAIIASQWYTALIKYRVSLDYQQPSGPPIWEFQDNILLKPLHIEERTSAALEKDLKQGGPFATRASRLIALAGDKYFSRMGWFTRTHALQLPSGRILLPMYSDGYSFSLVGISDDTGKSWTASEPIVGYGCIQPTVLRKRDGTLVAYMRDNGPPPKRVHISTSKDDGVSWEPAEDTEIPNPGTSLEAITLNDGNWLMVYNDLQSGRYSLAAALSDDEGKTWRWKRHLDGDPQHKSPNQYHYPSVIQAKDGSIHLTYSFFIKDAAPTANGKSIKHVQLNEAWIQAGD